MTGPDGQELPHRIEATVLVYLDWTGGAWAVSPSVVDDWPLDEPDGTGAACEFGVDCQDPDCAEQARLAQQTQVPTGAQLIDLLEQAAGR